MDLLINLFIKVEIYIIFLIALNSLMIGKLNLWAIGNIVYFSIGAFTTGFFVNTFMVTGFKLYSLLIIVPIITFLVSIVFFYISRILKQDFFLFFSLFFIELNFVLNNQLAGPSGYSHITRPPGLTSDLILLIVISVVLILFILWIILFDKSRINTLHTLIRNNEILASSFGINISKIQKPVFFASAIMSGVAGVFFAFYSFGADPQAFNTSEIIILFTLLIFSGIDSIKGAIVAGFIFVFLTYFLDSILSSNFKIIAPKLSQIVFGVLLIIVPIIIPKGLFGSRSI